MAETARSDTRAMAVGGKRDLNALAALAFASDPGHADTIDLAEVAGMRTPLDCRSMPGYHRQSRATRAALGQNHEMKRSRCSGSAPRVLSAAARGTPGALAR
jgi:hypothetical protein